MRSPLQSSHPLAAVTAVTLGATFLLVGCGSNSGAVTMDSGSSSGASSTGVGTGSASGSTSGTSNPSTGSASSAGASGATGSSGVVAATGASSGSGAVSGSTASGSVASGSGTSGSGASGAATSGASGSGSGASGSGSSADDAGTPVTWTEVYTTIISGKCASCHVTGKTGVSKGKLDLSTQATAYMNLVGVMAAGTSCGTSKQTRVVAGDSTTSLLYNKVSMAKPVCGERMPDDNPALVAASISTIKAWIDQGAINN
jgi:hypothetical protein